MKNKNIGGGGCQLNLISKKGPNAKCAKNAKIIKHFKIFPRSFRSLGILQIHISGAANRHAPVQYAKYVYFSFF